MEWETCRFITNSAVLAGETLCFHQCAQTLVGLLYLHWGEIELQVGDRSPILIRAKEASLISLGQKRRVRVQKDTAWTLCAIQCDRPEELLENWTTGQGPVRDCRNSPGVDHLLHQISILSLSPEQQQVLKLPGRLLRTLLDQGASTQLDIPAHLLAMRQIIDTQYQKNLTLEDLAVQVGKSKFHLSRAFQSCYHVTPGEYLTQVRLSHAAQLLASTDLPVQEIGQSVGISNGSYFTVLFKRQYGYPPREYRIKSRFIKEND